MLLDSIYFTFYYMFNKNRRFGTAIKVVSGKYEDIEKHGARKLYDVDDVEAQQEQIEEILDEGEGSDGEVSHFQALLQAQQATEALEIIPEAVLPLPLVGLVLPFWRLPPELVD